jgi:membrane protease YdiL (CAAX protease family)
VSARPVREDLVLAGWLGLAAGIATALVFPYLLDTMPTLRTSSPIPLPALAAVQAFQMVVLATLLSFFGLRMQPRATLDAPWLRALAARRPRPRVAWGNALLAGLLAGLVVAGLAVLLDPHLPPMLHPRAAAPAASAWHGLLASFYGGIAEELQLRLFLMTLLAWLAARLSRRAPTGRMYWAAIVLAALLFGAGHLPAAAQLWPLDAFVVFRVVALNAVAGIVFGWLYWRRGLEAAIVAHFAADLVLHVAAPLLPGGLS